MIRPALLAALLLAAAPVSAAPRCDEQCLTVLADRTLAALAAKDIRRLPWAGTVRFTENGVPIDIPDGLWGSTGDIPGKKALAVADGRTGEVVWLGTVYDHDQPAFGAMRLKVDAAGKLAEVELVVARKGNPGPYGDAARFTADPAFAQTLPAGERRSRKRLVAMADAYLSTRQQNDGRLGVGFTPDCALRVNGAPQTSGGEGPAAIAQGCEAQYRAGAYKPVERVRQRRFPVVDEARGLVVAFSQQDLPARETSFRTTDGQTHAIKDQFPMTRDVVEVLRIEGDRIARSEAISVYQPYRMRSPWTE